MWDGIGEIALVEEGEFMKIEFDWGDLGYTPSGLWAFGGKR